MVNHNNIATLIHDLASVEVAADDVFNQYQLGNNPNNAIRRANFTLYLQQIAERQPITLLVMEAPGYRGSRLTGVPVTSRKVLLEGVPALKLFGTENGFQDVADAGFEHIYSEQSATIVWNTLAELRHVPLIWNTFPFHPHETGKPLTNRRPRKRETELGGKFLQRVIDLFTPELIIAVGNVAHETLTGIGIPSAKIRHPAQGGKNDFVAGLTALLASV
jgi:uracil-DNA glycosylase